MARSGSRRCGVAELLIRSFVSIPTRCNCAATDKDDILWVTGHQWEAFGAVRQGLKVAWTNRARQPVLPISIEPTYTTKNLQEVADILAGR